MQRHVELSSNDLRLKLFDSLKNSGITDKLRSQLRSSLVAELQLRAAQFGTRPPFEKIQNTSPNQSLQSIFKSDNHGMLLNKVIDSMVIMYMKDRGYEYSLSVFMPECGLSLKHQMLTEKDILHVLHLDQENKSLCRSLKEAITSDKKESLLYSLMKAISKVGDVIMTSRDIQTEINPEELVEIQLRKVTKTLEASSEDQKRLNALAIEERVLKYQAELDVRLTKEMKEQLEQFKQVELATMRFEERQKYQVQIVQIQQDAEKRILQEKGKAIESQEAAKTLLEEQKKELDRQNIQLRQSLLDEGNKTIMAEKQLRNEAELNSKRAEMERDLAQRKYDEATKQINELQNYKERYERVMQEKMAQYKIDLNKEYAGSLSSVEVEKTKIEAERQILVERAKSAENTLAQALAIQKESAALRESLRDTRAELDDVRRERDDALNDIKELKLQVQSQRTSTAVEFEIQSLKTQLLEAERMNEKRQEEYQLLLKSFMTPKDETQKELAKARRMEENWKKECQQLVLKLDMEFSRSEQIERKYQDEVLKTKELRREVADLRRILHETQTALTSELSRRNTELGGVRYTIPNNNIQDTIVYSPDLSHFKPSEDNVNPTQCPPQEISESPMANKFTDIKIARHTRIPDPMMHLNEFRTPLQLNKRENLTAPLFHPPQDEESTNVDKNQEFSALVQFKPDVTFNQATNPMPKNNGSLVSNINTQTTPTSTKMITPQYKTDPSTTTPSVAENRNDAISDVANNTEYISKDGNSQKSIEMKSNPPKISPVDTSSPANVDIKPPSKVEDVEKETEVDEVVMDLAQLKLQREMRLREEERERMRVLREKQALEEGAEKDISSQKVTEMIEKKVDDVVVKDAKVEKENLDFKDDPLLQKYMEIVKEKREKEALSPKKPSIFEEVSESGYNPGFGNSNSDMSFGEGDTDEMSSGSVRKW